MAALGSLESRLRGEETSFQRFKATIAEQDAVSSCDIAVRAMGWSWML
jgi:hypothetical protein